MAEARKELISDAKSFCGSLENVFMHKKRDAQTQHILEKAKFLLNELVKDHQNGRSQRPPVPAKPARGGMGQLWVKLDEMKRENDDLKLQLGRCRDDRSNPTSAKHIAGPGEEIISDLHKTRSENVVLKQENTKLQKNSDELETVNLSLKDEYRRHKTALDTAQVTLENVFKENKRLEGKADKMLLENEQLKKDLERFRNSPQPSPIVAIRADNAIKIRADNRRFENISEKCRPSVIAMKYDTLESQEWMEAKESLEDTTNLSEEDVVRFLSSLLINVYDASQDMYNFMTHSLIEILKKPTSTKDQNRPQATELIEDAVPIDSIEEMPECLQDAIHSVLRQSWENVDARPIIEEAISKCSEANKIQDDVSVRTKAVEKFMVESARLCWQMIIQQPPMILSVSDTCYNETRHKLWWSCDQACASQIQYYVWPTLYDYEDGNVLVKGCVYCE